MATAKVSRPLTPDRVELADEPVYADADWVSAYELNPFEVPDADRSARMLELSGRLLDAAGRQPHQRESRPGAGEQVLRQPGRHQDPQQRVRLLPS